jgi:HlyD family secretion protein
MKEKATHIIKKIKNYINDHKKISITTGLILIIILIIIFRGKSVAPSATAATATRANVVDAVVLSGRTQSASAVTLGFADQGRIAYVPVAEGDKVTAGQVLAKLDTSDLDASLASAKASLVIAKAGSTSNVTNLQNVIDQQNSLVDNAYRTLLSSGLQAISSDSGSLLTPPTITGNYTGVEGQYVLSIYPSSANSGAAFTVSGLESGLNEQVSSTIPTPLGTKGLFIQFSAGQDYTNSRWVIDIPNKRSSQYTTNYNTYQAAVNAKQVAIVNAQSGVGTSTNDQSVAQAKIDQAKASVDSILAQIEKRTIRAPFDGIVANNSLKPGQSTSAITSGASSNTNSTSSQITLISENDYEVVLKAPEISVAKLVLGQPVSITLDAYGKDVSFPGKIVSINPAETIVDGVPVYETKVSFTKPDARIRSGMTATATITINQHNSVITIPSSFIRSDASGSYVYKLLADGKTQKQVVTTGLKGSDSMIEITNGLNEGDHINNDQIN